MPRIAIAIAIVIVLVLCFGSMINDVWPLGYFTELDGEVDTWSNTKLVDATLEQIFWLVLILVVFNNCMRGNSRD